MYREKSIKHRHYKIDRQTVFARGSCIRILGKFKRNGWWNRTFWRLFMEFHKFYGCKKPLPDALEAAKGQEFLISPVKKAQTATMMFTRIMLNPPSWVRFIYILPVRYGYANHFYLRQADYICCAAIKKFIENAEEILYNAQLVRVPFTWKQNRGGNELKRCRAASSCWFNQSLPYAERQMTGEKKWKRF